MRMFLLMPLLCAACSCQRISAAGEQRSTGSQAAADTVQLQLYERRTAKSDEVLAPPVLLRLFGTLEQKNGCLVVRSGTGDQALVFETGRAKYDASKRVLLIGSASFALGGPISVGGPFNQPAGNFDPLAVKKRCAVDAVWLVAGADVRLSP